MKESKFSKLSGKKISSVKFATESNETNTYNDDKITFLKERSTTAEKFC